MRNVELHVLYNSEDVELASLGGLADLTDHEVCEHCGEEVGYDAYGNFQPLVIALDEEEVWILCSECAGPSIAPTLYDAEEYEEFE